jgi:hypothetical protein
MRLFSMKNAMLALVIGLVLGVSGAALAATLNPAHIGSTCDGSGLWHFVNNQTGGGAGTLTLDFNDGCDVVSVVRTKVLTSVNQWDVTTSGDCTLEGASTNLLGNLVLSDLFCIPKKDECDPKTEKCP